MKTFFKIDAWLQMPLCIIALILLPVALFLNQKLITYIYLVTGLVQLCSFLIRLMLPYPKSKLYKLYGWLMMPVWIMLLLFMLNTANVGWPLGLLVLIYMVAALFFSPIIAIAYAQDCWSVYKASIYKIQKFLQLVNN